MVYNTWVCDDLEADIRMLHESRGIDPVKSTIADRTTQEYIESAFNMTFYTPKERAGLARIAIVNAAEDGRDVRDLIHILDVYCAANNVCVKDKKDAGQED